MISGSLVGILGEHSRMAKMWNSNMLGELPTCACSAKCSRPTAYERGGRGCRHGLGRLAASFFTEFEPRAHGRPVHVVIGRPARGAPAYSASYASFVQRAMRVAQPMRSRISGLGRSVLAQRLLCQPPADGSLPRCGGASVGVVWLTRAITQLPPGISAPNAVDALGTRATYSGTERKTHHALASHTLV